MDNDTLTHQSLENSDVISEEFIFNKLFENISKHIISYIEEK